MQTIEFMIKGKPQGKGRPRFRRIGKYVSTYNPKSTSDYEKLVIKSFQEQVKSDMSKWTGKVRIDIQAMFLPPKSLSKKQREYLDGHPHLKKPDADNISKIILDSLNGIAYKDDSQIYELTVSKYYWNDEFVQVYIFYEE